MFAESPINHHIYKLVCMLILILGKNVQAQREIKPCQQEPAFIRTLGYDPLWTALSTSEKKTVGIVLVQFEQQAGQTAPTPQTPQRSVYQHPSWQSAGYMSSITFDKDGNAYSIPTPLISMLYNPKEKLNTIYRIDAYTGVMKEWLSLPYAAKPSSGNPYGLLGITYDCTAGLLLAATVSGSDRYSEKGLIYSIHTATRKIADTLKAKDAMALTVAYDEKDQKRLYFGRTRTGEIYSLPLTAEGKFIRKQMRKELSLEGYGPRGDDKARKIKFAGGTMMVSGVAFNYNLQASSEKPETNYSFRWNNLQKKWELYDLN